MSNLHKMFEFIHVKFTVSGQSA